MMIALILAGLLGAVAQGASISGTCAPDQVSILCNGVTPGATTYWTGQNTYSQAVNSQGGVVSSGPVSIPYSNLATPGLQVSSGLWVAGGLITKGSFGTVNFPAGVTVDAMLEKGLYVGGGIVTNSGYWGSGFNINNLDPLKMPAVIAQTDKQNIFTSSQQFTASGANYSILASSSIVMLGGGMTVPYIKGDLYGSAYQTTGYAVIASSEAVGAHNVGIVSYVGVATATVSMRGGRPTLVNISVNILNGSGSVRIYSLVLTHNGDAVTGSRTQTITTGDYAIISFTGLVTSTAGSNIFCLNVKSNNATGSPQSAIDTHIYGIEL